MLPKAIMPLAVSDSFWRISRFSTTVSPASKAVTHTPPPPLSAWLPAIVPPLTSRPEG